MRVEPSVWPYHFCKITYFEIFSITRMFFEVPGNAEQSEVSGAGLSSMNKLVGTRVRDISSKSLMFYIYELSSGDIFQEYF